MIPSSKTGPAAAAYAKLRHAGVLGLLSVLLCLVSPASPAAFDLYTISVPVDTADPAARDAANGIALNEILIRVTGSDDAEHLAKLAALFPNPSRYVLRYRPVPNNALEISFDGEAIERALRGARFAVWGGERPLTLVWLAVDWGQGEREIIAADDAMPIPNATRSIDRNRMLRQRMEQIADKRGIPIAFPLLDTEDLESISFPDVWGGFDERLLEASRRYGASSILVGRLRVAAAERNRWTWYFGDDRLTWSGEPEAVVQLVANELAANFAVPGGAPLETYTLTVDGIHSISAYGQVQNMLDNLGVIEDYVLRSVVGSRMLFSIRVYGSIDRLDKALELSGVVRPAIMLNLPPAGESGAGGTPGLSDPRLLTFEYRPGAG